ncbi:ribosome biogenesis GTPase [Thalassobacillus cyri]|uniref:Small ribosomal subunit biogenesis GTPase RsgA n=1 Tax=Thalassobacillus cyri TaxID=571932 RepID=A0A1H4HE18_9BACI|nr:ribosome small subunit-dependent GTPase A [Thalassobacillus cyri]SEB19700.1 ribosome biogenesis GTPase [Thalassobacillus cyri]
MPVGKITKALSGFYYVYSEGKVYQCKGRGVFRKQKITPLVGDEVTFEADNQKEGYVLSIGKRKNELVRPPVANVDQALIMTSAKDPAFNPLLLDRFLVLVEANRIEPLIVISKVDGSKEEGDIHAFQELYQQAGYTVILTSKDKDIALEEIQSHLTGKITVVAGQSGVGKSTLLNHLDPELDIETNEISESLGRGKHTTRHVELFEIAGGLVADTPGFSSLEFQELEEDQLPECFPEFREVQHLCKFRGCLHKKEPKCAVKAAVDNGEIASQRYEHYLQFLEEIQTRKPRY